MKNVFTVVINWNVQKPSTVIDVATGVSEKMKDNEHFLTPKVPMTDFDEKLNRAQKAYINRDNGKLAQIELTNAISDLDIALRTQSRYVNEASGYDQAIIETSGYKASKGYNTKSVEPDMPTNVKLTSKNGNVTAKAKKPKGAASLCWAVYYGEVKEMVTVAKNMLSVPAGTAVQIIPCGKANEVIKGLQTGTRVSVQVLAQNAAGKSALSELYTVFVNK